MDENTKQLNLFDMPKKKPRPLKAPQAVPTAFGWLFQVIAAIVLSLEYKDNLEKVKVEGKTEDIELVFTDRAPMYVQAKSVSGDIGDTKEAARHCDNALNTLINATNVVKEEYSNLMYISNLMNPMNLKEYDRLARWLPQEDRLYVRDYDQLPKAGKEYLEARKQTAENNLQKKGYLSADDHFHWNKFKIATLIFARSESSSQKCVALEEQIKDLLKESTLSVRENIINLLRARYYDNATNYETEIRKEDICWIFIVKYLASIITSEYTDDVDIDDLDEVQGYVDNFLSEQEGNIDAVNEVLSRYNEIQKDSTYKNIKGNKEKIEVFLDKYWDEFKELFPIKNERIQREGMKILVTKILRKRRIIQNLKKEFKIDGNKRAKN